MIQIRNIVTEGPDCCGKTTLYSNIHKVTKFKWNIQDRSHLSMLCYARQFHRGIYEIEHWRSELNAFLNDLNNRLIVLLPDYHEIIKRFYVRGDEIQNADSLIELHLIFKEEVDRLGNRPNLLVINDVLPPEELAQRCVDWLNSGFNSIEAVSNAIEFLVKSTTEKEIVNCCFRINMSPRLFNEADADVMNYLPEKEYYSKILSDVMTNMQNEIAGINEYSTHQHPLTTRRFIFTQNSCISLIHTVIRENLFRMKVYCRSSEVSKTFHYDLKFIYYLYSQIYYYIFNNFNEQIPNNYQFFIDVEMGSAHIR